jgi:dipeptidyl aminopeptidase/acylaminoacyl peptidase
MKSKRKAKKRFVEAEDLCRLSVVTSATMSPDEKKIAYTIETISEDKRKYYSHIYMADIATGESQRFTFGEVADRGLAWSPDGKKIAFVSTRNKKTGIYVMPAEGGAERKVITEDGNFSGLNWTPDGKELVYQFRYNDSHLEKDEKKKKEAPLYRHITRLWYRLDGAGWLPKDRFHIWKVDVESGKSRQTTRGKRDNTNPAVSPDGKLIAFVSNRSKDPDLDSMKEDLMIISINGGKERKIPTPAGPVGLPSFSPDGKKLAYMGHSYPDSSWGVTNFHIWTVGVSGKPAAKDIIPKFDRQVYDQTIGDMGEGFDAQPPQWSPDGKRIYFAAADTGSTHLFYVPARGGLPTRVTKKNCHVKGYSINGRKKLVAAVVSDLRAPGELRLFPAAYNGDRKSRTLTASNKQLFSGIAFPRVREVWFKAYDGTALQGWLVTPPNMNRNRRYPGILEIHGGPTAQYGFTFFHEMLYLASKGFVVFYTNPRGGGGQGETWAGTIIGDWGSIDYQDCMAAADYLERLPYVNAKRMGVTGGSYGGYMTNWIVGHTNRFKAAVTQRSVVDLNSFVGSSDMGYELWREFEGQPWTVPETYERCSPLTYAKNIKTPLLIIHSEQDLRCSIEQAEQLFVTLKLMKKKVELVRFPEEPHGLSRHGRPDRRIARLNWIVKWFEKYLK